mgnify:FL=1
MAPPASDWLPAALNQGYVYRDRIDQGGERVSAFLAARYPHVSQSGWIERLVAGELWCNGRQLQADAALAPGDRLAWHRPPWQEAAVPVLQRHAVVFDDGDLLVLNKPSGLPVLPAGGFLEHTLLRQLEGWHTQGVLDPAAGLPRPVHRLGRFTSGLLVCARRPASRAWLSALLREGTAAAGAAAPTCRKLYRALTQPLPTDWAPGETRLQQQPIGRRPHPLLGAIWCAAAADDPAPLAASSTITLLERRHDSCLVEVWIATGRPHQIRIHTAALGAPLLGDPLYGPGGLARPEALPGDGGYLLHAHRLALPLADGRRLELEAPPPAGLCLSPSCLT